MIFWKVLSECCNAIGMQFIDESYCRWKFFEAIQIAFRKKQNLDINLDQALEKSNDKIASNEKLTLGENV